MVQVGQQAHIGVGEWRLRAPELEVVDLRRGVGATDDVEPLLHFVLVLELRRCPVPVPLKNSPRSNSSNSP